MGVHTVLVVGAGIAGSTVACLLGRRGLAVTVLEWSAGQRSSGSPVDVRGPADRVVERMGLVPAIRARDSDRRGDAHGAPAPPTR